MSREVADARSGVRYTADGLRGIIELAGITQKEAAERLGVDERTMRRYLAGARAIPFSIGYAAESLADLG